MEKECILNELENLISEGNDKVVPTKWWSETSMGERVDGAIYTGWYTKALFVLNHILTPDNSYLMTFSKLDENYYYCAKAGISILENIVEYIKKGMISTDSIHSNDIKNQGLKIIFSRFHKVVRQLRYRYDNRPAFDVDDEYDVQDLLHALLKMFFEDIRKEEWTPSYGGKSARMDFLLKDEKIVIEIKKTRKGLTDKEIGDQLIIDVERYQAHPDCKKLICFIYDPEARLGNPEGMKRDLNSRHHGFVEVIIEPLN